MYYVNEEQIEVRLNFIPTLADVCSKLTHEWKTQDLVHQFAQERTLHLAIETVTDVGSMLIDGFLMRDASSYEDIVEILRGEGVFPEETAATLMELVRQRRALTQEYTSWVREGLHPLMNELPQVLDVFAQSVRAFIKKELRR